MYINLWACILNFVLMGWLEDDSVLCNLSTHNVYKVLFNLIPSGVMLYSYDFMYVHIRGRHIEHEIGFISGA